MHQSCDPMDVSINATYASLVALNEIMISYHCAKHGGSYRFNADELVKLRVQLSECSYQARQYLAEHQACAMFGNAAC